MRHGMLTRLPGAGARDDPLFYVRSYVENFHRCGIYRVYLPATWAACYLEDELRPGTRAYRKRQKESEAFTALLMDRPKPKRSPVRRAGSRT